MHRGPAIANAGIPSSTIGQDHNAVMDPMAMVEEAMPAETTLTEMERLD